MKEDNSLGLDVSGSSPEAQLLRAEDDIEGSLAAPRKQRSDDIPDGEVDSKPINPNLKREKTKPYVNPERVNTGGSQRPKLTEDELAERMNRIRVQNDKIKEKREKVKADEAAFKTTVAAENALLAQREAERRKVQAEVDHTREENAKRKLAKMGNREWDHHKQDDNWKKGKRPSGDTGFWSNPDQGGSGSPDGKGRQGSKRGNQDKNSSQDIENGTIAEIRPVENEPSHKPAGKKREANRNVTKPRRDSKATVVPTEQPVEESSKQDDSPAKLPEDETDPWLTSNPSW